MAKEKPMRLVSVEFLFPVALFVMFVILLTETFTMPIRPREVPTVFINITLVALAILIIRNFRQWLKSREALAGQIITFDYKNPVLIGFALLAGYVVAINIIGFILASVAYCAATMVIFGRRDKRTVALISIGSGLFIWAVFTLILEIRFPLGLFELLIS